jgi:hypothetical protein
MKREKPSKTSKEKAGIYGVGKDASKKRQGKA